MDFTGLAFAAANRKVDHLWEPQLVASCTGLLEVALPFLLGDQLAE